MIDDFILRALAAGILVALISGPLGSFVVWRGMAYFGDAMAQSALLGVGLGLLLGVRPDLGAALVCIVLAILLTLPRLQSKLSMDSLLGIVAHAALAIGLLVISQLDNVRIDLMAYLFGDVLAVNVLDLYWLTGGAAVVIGMLLWVWRDLLAVTVHPELAAAEGVSVLRTQIVLTALVAITVALAMKIVGVLLITAMLIIPAAAARMFARSPEAMALLAAAVGVVSVFLGVAGSLQWDTPTGPSIVVAATVVFVTAQVRFAR